MTLYNLVTLVMMLGVLFIIVRSCSHALIGA